MRIQAMIMATAAADIAVAAAAATDIEVCSQTDFLRADLC
jgi:hypothetical protein